MASYRRGIQRYYDEWYPSPQEYSQPSGNDSYQSANTVSWNYQPYGHSHPAPQKTMLEEIYAYAEKFKRPRKEIRDLIERNNECPQPPSYVPAVDSGLAGRERIFSSPPVSTPYPFGDRVSRLQSRLDAMKSSLDSDESRMESHTAALRNLDIQNRELMTYWREVSSPDLEGSEVVEESGFDVVRVEFPTPDESIECDECIDEVSFDITPEEVPMDTPQKLDDMDRSFVPQILLRVPRIVFPKSILGERDLDDYDFCEDDCVDISPEELVPDVHIFLPPVDFVTPVMPCVISLSSYFSICLHDYVSIFVVAAGHELKPPLWDKRLVDCMKGAFGNLPRKKPR